MNAAASAAPRSEDTNAFSETKRFPAAPATLLDFDSSLPTSTATSTHPPFTLAVYAEPAGVAPGETVTFTILLHNTHKAALDRVSVRAKIPEGLTQVPGQAGWSYDAAERYAVVTVDTLAAREVARLTFQMLAKGPADRLTTVVVEGSVGEYTTSASTEVWIANPTTAEIGPDGGKLRSEDGCVQVEFPSGAVRETTSVTVKRYREAPLRGGQMGSVLRFSLAPDVTFEQPVTLTVRLDGLITLRDLPAGWQPFLAHIRGSAPGDQEFVPLVKVDWEKGTLTARLQHFSDYSAGVISENGWQLLFNDALVAGFRGSLSYHYPLKVPPGRGGLQPDLALSYNSDRIDGIRAVVQSDWVGLGWSLDVPQIVRRVHWCANGNGNICTDTSHPDYTLVIDGTGYTLVPGEGVDPNEVPNQGVGRYHTDEETFFFIEKRTTPVNERGTYWIVKTRDGTEYEFGHTLDAEQVLCHVDWLGNTVYRWRLNKIRDTHGNEIIFQYDEVRTSYYCERESYLSHIWYNQRDDQTWGTHIEFVRASRPANKDGDRDDFTHPLFFQYSYLNKVRVTHGGQLTREYRLAYSFHGNSRRLQSVTEHGADGSALPATTFEYGLYDNTASNWAGGKTYPYSRLTAVNNGYGGRIEVDYQRATGKADTYYHYRVGERRTLDGLGHTARRLYTYGDPCWDAPGPCDDGHYGWALKGYHWQAEEVRGYDGDVLRRTHSTFVLPWPLTGRVGKQEIRDRCRGGAASHRDELGLRLGDSLDGRLSHRGGLLPSGSSRHHRLQRRRERQHTGRV